MSQVAVVAAIAFWVLNGKSSNIKTLGTLPLASAVSQGWSLALRLALAFYDQRNMDFADGLLAAKALQDPAPAVYSFDRDFDRVPRLTRHEPS